MEVLTAQSTHNEKIFNTDLSYGKKYLILTYHNEKIFNTDVS